MGREIRRVPLGWEHPKDERGRYLPLYDKDFATAAAEWKESFAAWENGTHEDLQADPSRREGCEFWEWEGDPPNREHYRPKWEAEPTCFQVYETVSEGTPVSPVFADKPALVQWLVDHGHSEAAAQAFAEGGWAPSFIVYPNPSGRAEIVSGIDALGRGR